MLPAPRGPLSEHAMRLLTGERAGAAPTTAAVVDPLGDDDLHLALYCCYEMHYRGFEGVDPAMEWEPAVIAFRRSLESAFESAMRDIVGVRGFGGLDVAHELRAAIEDSTGPSLSAYMSAEGSIDELREFAIHRSAYQLKEADPHTWAIPRVHGDTKAALVHIQCDEYGFGRADDMHSVLFAATMRALDLDDTYGAYIPLLPGTTLATLNLVSMFGLHRRLRGAAIGHLTVFEMTSVEPMARYAAALTRLGLPEAARRFYDVHVIADADHEVVALERMAHSLARDEPETVPEIAFGAHAVLEIERRFAESLLAAWSRGRSSLRVVERAAA